MAVFMLGKIREALSIDPQFKNGSNTTLQNLVYRFIKRPSLSVRIRTHFSQYHLQ